MSDKPKDVTPQQLTDMLLLSIFGIKNSQNDTKGGKNGFVVDVQDNKICDVKSPAAVDAMRKASERITTAIKPMLDMLDKLPDEIRDDFQREALFLAANCADIAVQTNKALGTANRSYNSRDADTDDDQQIIDMVAKAVGKSDTEKLKAVHAALGGIGDFESFRRRYYRVKKRLGV